MKKYLFISLLLCACSSVPHCLKDKIGEFDQQQKCATAKVDAYTFQGNKVYVFDPGQCGADMTSVVLDENCKILGHLGGFIGNTKINGQPFSEAVFVKTVWKK